MSKAIYKLNINCGRMGSLTGLFIAHKEYVDVLLKEKIRIYFGEVLGKHSEIYGEVEDEEIEFVSDNPEVVKVVEENNLTHGCSPFDAECMEQEIQGIDITDMDVDEAVEEIYKNQNND